MDERGDVQHAGDHDLRGQCRGTGQGRSFFRSIDRPQELAVFLALLLAMAEEMNVELLAGQVLLQLRQVWESKSKQAKEISVE